MISLWICTHCCLFRIRCFGVNMTPMWYNRIFIWFVYAVWFFARPFVLSILDFILEFLKYRPHHDINEECILLEDIQNSQPHRILYLDDVFFNWGGNNERNVESLIMILLSAYLASLSPSYTGSLTMMLWSSRTETYSNSFGTSCGSVLPPMFTFRQ